MMRLFKHCLFLGFLMSIFSACGDQPYSSDVPNPENPNKPVEEVPPSPRSVLGSVSGIVDIGSPVSNARVSIYTFTGAKIGEELGSSTTDSEGHYKIELFERFEGPCVLVSEGGEYVEPSTQSSTKITDKQILSAPITGIKVENEIAINAWTTWAAARTKSSRSSFDSDKAAILTNLSLMSKHLKKDAEDEAILNVKAVNIFINGVRSDDFNVLVLLSQQGLSALAEETYHVSTAQLILLLAEDLADGVFNDSEATRSKLVLKIYETLEKIKKRPKTSTTTTLGFSPGVFLKKDGFFDTLSLDLNKLLYLEKDVPMSPEGVLGLPMLYKLQVDDVEKLKADLDPILISAEVKSPKEVIQIDASLIELTKPINCTSPLENDLVAIGFPIEKLKTCQVSEEEEKVLGDPIRLRVHNGRINGTFPGKPGDLKKGIRYKVSVTAKHKSGNDRTFETEPFSPILDPVQSSEKERLFHSAIAQNNEEVALQFILEGINVTAKTKTGNTPLMVAIGVENPKILRGLVWAGVDLNAKDELGKTASDYAREQKKPGALKIIQEILYVGVRNRINKHIIDYSSYDLNENGNCRSMQFEAFTSKCVTLKELETLREINAAPVCSNGEYFQSAFCKKKIK